MSKRNEVEEAESEREFVEWWHAWSEPRFEHRTKYVVAGLPLATHLKAQRDTFDDLCLLYAGLRPSAQERLIQGLASWWRSLRDLEERIWPAKPPKAGRPVMKLKRRRLA
jgi:hypothetical protein